MKKNDDTCEHALNIALTIKANLTQGLSSPREINSRQFIVEVVSMSSVDANGCPDSVHLISGKRGDDSNFLPKKFSMFS